MKIGPPGDLFDQLLGQMCWIRGKLAGRGSHSLIHGRGCFGDLPGEGIVVSPPPPIVETLLVRKFGKNGGKTHEKKLDQKNS